MDTDVLVWLKPFELDTLVDGCFDPDFFGYVPMIYIKHIILFLLSVGLAYCILLSYSYFLRFSSQSFIFNFKDFVIISNNFKIS